MYVILKLAFLSETVAFEIPLRRHRTIVDFRKALLSKPIFTTISHTVPTCRCSS